MHPQESTANIARMHSIKKSNAALAALRAQPVPEVGFGNITQPDHSELVAPRSLSDYEIEAIAVCREAGHVSVSRVQRHLKIGYNLANTLCESIIDLGQVDGLEVAPSLFDARNKRLAAIGETME